MSVEKVNVAQKHSLFSEHWSSKVVGGSNRQRVKPQVEFLVVERGIEHLPVAEAEVSVMLFEPASSVNAGSAGGALTVELDRI